MLLTASHSWTLHHLRNLLLVALSLFLLPFSAFAVILARFLRFFSIVRTPKIKPSVRNGRQVRVLVTGVGMAKGLFLCRSFYLGGCHVVAADFQKHADVPCGRFSRAVSRYYSFSNPDKFGLEMYVAEIIDVIETEQIDLCVTCSGVATAVEDAKLVTFLEKSTGCKVFQLNEDAVRSLDDKLEFMKQTDDLGLANSEWHSLRSSSEVPTVVNRLRMEAAQGNATKYIVKNAGMDDASRGAIPTLDASRLDEMSAVLTALEYSNEKKWVLQEYFRGSEEYCTHAVVVNGAVKAFTACPSASVLMHYELLDPDSRLYEEMLTFTQSYAAALHEKYGHCTGHVSFDFRVRDRLVDGGRVKSLVPIECNPRCHTATVIFRGREVELTEAYLCALHEEEYAHKTLEADRKHTGSFYWTAHDIVALLILPALHVDLFEHIFRLPETLKQQAKCVNHFLTWKDPTFEWWDPMPWFILNHIYWPLELLTASLSGIKWKQLNVSTTKTFKC